MGIRFVQKSMTLNEQNACNQQVICYGHNVRLILAVLIYLLVGIQAILYTSRYTPSLTVAISTVI